MSRTDQPGQQVDRDHSSGSRAESTSTSAARSTGNNARASTGGPTQLQSIAPVEHQNLVITTGFRPVDGAEPRRRGAPSTCIRRLATPSSGSPLRDERPPRWGEGHRTGLALAAFLSLGRDNLSGRRHTKISQAKHGTEPASASSSAERGAGAHDVLSATLRDDI